MFAVSLEMLGYDLFFLNVPLLEELDDLDVFLDLGNLGES